MHHSIVVMYMLPTLLPAKLVNKLESHAQALEALQMLKKDKLQKTKELWLASVYFHAACLFWPLYDQHNSL
jgi:hypothetical protein